MAGYIVPLFFLATLSPRLVWSARMKAGSYVNLTTKEECSKKTISGQPGHSTFHDCDKSDRCYWDGASCLPRCDSPENQNVLNCLNDGTTICAWSDVTQTCSRKALLSPIVIVPGDGSNQLEARFKKETTPSWLCQKQSGWFRLWLKTSDLLLSTSCWADTIKLLYDEENDTLSNNVGVETRVPGFGDTSGIEELDPSVPFHATAAFYQIVEALVKAGYERGVSVRGAPYDFRFAPSSPVGAQYIDDLQRLIEDSVNANKQRATLISHSMGGLQSLFLLARQSQEWKDKFIERWIPIAAPWGGAAKVLRLQASGDNQGLPVDPLEIREEQRSYETNFWLAPVPRWFGDTAIILAKDRNYSAQDYDSFFNDIEFPTGKRLHDRIADLTSAVEAPGVDVACLYSLGVETPAVFDYADKGFDAQPVISNGDGDGTVNSISLKLCDRWVADEKPSHAVKIQRFAGLTHSGMLADDKVIASILQELGLAATNT